MFKIILSTMAVAVFMDSSMACDKIVPGDYFSIDPENKNISVMTVTPVEIDSWEADAAPIVKFSIEVYAVIRPVYQGEGFGYGENPSAYVAAGYDTFSSEKSVREDTPHTVNCEEGYLRYSAQNGDILYQFQDNTITKYLGMPFNEEADLFKLDKLQLVQTPEETKKFEADKTLVLALRRIQDDAGERDWLLEALQDDQKLTSKIVSRLQLIKFEKIRMQKFVKDYSDKKYLEGTIPALQGFIDEISSQQE